MLLLAAIAATACGSSPAGKPDGGAACVNPATAQEGSIGTIASVASLVSRTCATAGCHDRIQHEHGMDLSTADLIYGNWVNKKGLDHCSNQPMVRVVPGDPDASFVMTKVRATGVLCGLGDRMPPAPAAMLTACEIEIIRSWIAAGAPPLPTGVDAGDADATTDSAGDASDDSNADADDPGVCTAAKPCDPASEICVEVMPLSGGADCETRWECYTHLDDETVQHACPIETATFCACDGTTYEASYACPLRPYDHIGPCGDGHSCDANRVRCATPAPSCPDDQAPAVIAGCWGPCVPIGGCRCDQNWQCPQRDKYRCSLLPAFRCAPIPTDGGTDTPI
jgi:hypothetical protein